MRYVEIAAVVEELAARLPGAGVQKAWSPRDGFCVLELRVRGAGGWRSAFLTLSVEPDVARIGIAPERPAAAEEPSSFQRWLRQELAGARVRTVGLAPGDRIVRVELEAGRGPRTLIAELTPGGVLLLAGASDRILATSGRPPSGRALAPGLTWLPPAATLRAELKEAPSRLGQGGDPLFPVASAAEAEHAGRERALRAEAARRQALAPLKAKRTRLKRTLEKVRAEASRQADAQAHRRAGELLSQNLHKVARGAAKVVVTEYAPEGPREVELALAPERSPKEQVEWHFHQYRRLTRGCEAAARRRVELEREAGEVEAAIAKVESAAPGELPAAPAPARAARDRPQVAMPYKEFLAAGEQRIWVGKGGKDNDTLTFRLAKPYHLWLHARGVPGSHVVVPLERGAELPQEVLLDAAHLALHFSQAKGEPSGEVSYTQAKYVKRQKGGAPGAVTFTRERTFLVRVQPDRLERLLRTREA